MWSKQIFWYKLSSFPPLKNTVNNMYSLLFLDKYVLKNRVRTRLGLTNHFVLWIPGLYEWVCIQINFFEIYNFFVWPGKKTFLKRFEHWSRWSKQIFWYKLSSFPPLKNTVLPRFRVSNVNIFLKLYINLMPLISSLLWSLHHENISFRSKVIPINILTWNDLS
jgi:hypothetical protein